MAQRTRMRRTLRRTGPRVRRVPAATVMAARGPARHEQAPAGGLTIGGAHDPAEKAADRAADRVMRMPAAPRFVQRECAECAEGDKDAKRQPAGEEEQTVRKKAGPGAGPVAPGAASAPASAGQANAIGSLGGGRPLASAERAFFEPRFGADLSPVRVHDGDGADRASKAVDARAFSLGKDVAFRRGEYVPGSEGGRRLMAHELAHVVESGNAPPRIRRTLSNCTGDTNEDSIVTSHTLTSDKIAKPGDSAGIKIAFSCKPRSFDSQIVDSAGTVLVTGRKDIWSNNFSPSDAGEWTTAWDGKRGYTNVGSFMVDDGTYKHRISNVSYAAGAKADKIAKSGGVLSTSPDIVVSTRAGVTGARKLTAAEQAAAVANAPADQKEAAKTAAKTQTVEQSQHLFDATGTVRQTNIDTMANAIKSEAGDYGEADKKAIAWAIRNEMVRINSFSVTDAKAAFKFATDRAGGDSEKAIAQDVLSQKMSADPTSGAIKWYSPKSMPPNNTRAICKPKGTYDCSGGTVSLVDDPTKSSMAPGFAGNMTFVSISGVNEWNFRFFKL